MSSKQAPHSSADAIASWRPILTRPGFKGATSLLAASARKRMRRMYPIDTAIQGTRPILDREK